MVTLLGKHISLTALWCRVLVSFKKILHHLGNNFRTLQPYRLGLSFYYIFLSREKGGRGGVSRPSHTPTWEPGETHRNKKILRILTLFSSNHGLLVPIMDPIMDFLWGSAPWNMVVGSTKNMIKSWRNKILCKSVPKTESSYKQNLARRVI